MQFQGACFSERSNSGLRREQNRRAEEGSSCLGKEMRFTCKWAERFLGAPLSASGYPAMP